MNDPLIPWWLVLLLGMWAVALTLWVHPNVHREVRLWSGLSTLVYLALIFLAIGANLHQDLPSLSPTALSRLADISFAICLAVSLTASVYCLGRISLPCRRLAYLVHTLANACLCVLLQQPEVAFGLLIVVCVVAKPLIRRFTIPELNCVRHWLMTATRFTEEPVSSAKKSEYWLIGGLVSILAFTLLGTISLTLRGEMLRVASSPGHTALPTRDRLNQVLSNRNGPDRVASPLGLAFGRRSDLVVLMTVIIFLYLAMSMAHDTEPDKVGSDDEKISLTTSQGSIHEC